MADEYLLAERERITVQPNQCGSRDDRRTGSLPDAQSIFAEFLWCSILLITLSLTSVAWPVSASELSTALDDSGAPLKVNPNDAQSESDRLDSWIEVKPELPPSQGRDEVPFLVENTHQPSCKSLNPAIYSLFAIGNFTKAAVFLDDLLKRSPLDTNAWFDLGTCRSALHDYHGALAAYNMVLSIEPTSLDAKRAAVAMKDEIEKQEEIKKQKFDLANQRVEKIRKIDELIKSREFFEATKTIKEFLKIEPANPDMWLKLGICKEGERDYHSALAAYEMCSRLAPTNTRALSAASTIRARFGGNAVSSPMQNDDDLTGPYLEDLLRRIKRAWDPPRGALRKVVMAFKIDTSGNTSEVRLLESRGYDNSDDAARRGIASATPFRELPNGSPGQVSVTVYFDAKEPERVNTKDMRIYINQSMTSTTQRDAAPSRSPGAFSSAYIRSASGSFAQTTGAARTPRAVRLQKSSFEVWLDRTHPEYSKQKVTGKIVTTGGAFRQTLGAFGFDTVKVSVDDLGSVPLHDVKLIAIDSVLPNAAIMSLRRFVSMGGFLLSTDQGLLALERGFPGHIRSNPGVVPTRLVPASITNANPKLTLGLHSDVLWQTNEKSSYIRVVREDNLEILARCEPSLIGDMDSTGALAASYNYGAGKIMHITGNADDGRLGIIELIKDPIEGSNIAARHAIVANFVLSALTKEAD